ncbi:MAG: SurA N-terminal domain-containing protein [Cohaesibacter sp.]|jgi:peptidyl-prolyl cis-trans isomerase SurA|nr:SurA N-terminal domain-containing protein [Cohaesibacter sp.]
MARRYLHPFTLLAIFCLSLSGVSLTNMAPAFAASKIVAIVDGAVITDYDIKQRQKLDRLLSGGKSRKGRSATLADLVDGKMQQIEAKRVGMLASDAEVNQAMSNMAANVRMSKKQMISVLGRSGIASATLKDWLKTQLSWQAIIKARFNAVVRIEEADIARAIVKKKGDKDKIDSAIRYDLTQITFIVPRKSSKQEAKRRLGLANRFRANFKSCAKDIDGARNLKDVVVSRVGRRTSTDLPVAIAKLLADTKVNGLTKPSRASTGYEMLAVCGKKELGKSVALRSVAKGELQTKRGNSMSRSYLRELRARSVVEYR